MHSLNERSDVLNSLMNQDYHSSIRPYLKENRDSVSTNNELKLLPISDLEVGFDANKTDASFAYRGGLGGAADFNFRGRLNVQLNYMYALANGPSYLDSNASQLGVANSFGLTQKIGDGFGNHVINGNVHYRASKHFSFQAGNGKNFIGDGYRSVLLSDVANNNLYGKITTKVWNVEYVNIFAKQRHIYGHEDQRSKDRYKYTATHYLNWNITKRVSLGLFETIIWQAKDTLLNRGFELHYLNPIIFYRPVEYQQGSADNAIMGLNVKFDASKKTRLYGQFMIDEFLLDEIKAGNGWWANKFGGQLGVKSFDVGKIEGLDVQLEWSAIRPFTFSHGATVQSYGHDNGSLGNPYGANYQEFVAIGRYAKGKWNFELQMNIASHGEDSIPSISYGGNIFKSYSNRLEEYNHTLGQGIATSIFYTHAKAQYRLTDKFPLWAEVAYSFRSRSNRIETEYNHYVHVGLKTNLWNRYSDY